MHSLQNFQSQNQFDIFLSLSFNITNAVEDAQMFVYRTKTDKSPSLEK